MNSALSKGEKCILVTILLIAVGASFLVCDQDVSAADYTSSHFIMRDPVITVGGDWTEHGAHSLRLLCRGIAGGTRG
jgi:hypothetical protein